MPRLVFESCSILTLDTETKPQYYENGTVVVEKDMIILVLDGLLAETERKIDDKRIDASDKLLMPGLVDLHCESQFTQERLRKVHFMKTLIGFVIVSSSHCHS